MTRSERLFKEGKCDTTFGVAKIITHNEIIDRKDICYFGSEEGIINGKEKDIDIYVSDINNEYYVLN